MFSLSRSSRGSSTVIFSWSPCTKCWCGNRRVAFGAWLLVLLVEVWALYYYPLSFQPNLSLTTFFGFFRLAVAGEKTDTTFFFSKAFEPILRHVLREKTLWFVSWHADIHVTPEWQDLSMGKLKQLTCSKLQRPVTLHWNNIFLWNFF